MKKNKTKLLQVGDVFTVNVKEVIKQYDAEEYGFDKIKATDEYVVIRAEDEGGETGGGMTGHEFWPDGHHITAKLLKNGKWNENGKTFEFYQDGCFRNEIKPENIVIKRKMKIMFV